MARPQAPDLISMNNTYIGWAVTKTQKFNLVSPLDGHTKEILLVYDSGCEMTQASFDLRPYSFGDRSCNVEITTLSSTFDSSHGLGRFHLQSLLDESKMFALDCLYQDLSAVKLKPFKIEVPIPWQTSYGLPPVIETPAGAGVILLGSDMEVFHPVPIARHDRLLLTCSQLDGGLVFGGCISAEAGQENLPNITQHQLRTTVLRAAVRGHGAED